MKVYTFNNLAGININGKDYYLIRGYKSFGEIVFIQVSGETPLHKEDLPDKDWEIIKTKSNSDVFYTAYKKSLFRYNTEAKQYRVMFIGATTQGSRYLALKWAANKFNIQYNEERLSRLSESEELPHITMMSDIGSTNEKAVMITVDEFFVRWNNANEMFKGESHV